MALIRKHLISLGSFVSLCYLMPLTSQKLSYSLALPGHLTPPSPLHQPQAFTAVGPQLTRADRAPPPVNRLRPATWWGMQVFPGPPPIPALSWETGSEMLSGAGRKFPGEPGGGEGRMRTLNWDMAAPQTLWGWDALRVVPRAQGLSLDALNWSSDVAAPEKQRGSRGRRLFPDRDWAEGYCQPPPQAAE